jgi:hypothetical protein
LETAPALKRLTLGRKEDLTLLRLFDPRGYYIGK